MFRQRKVRPNGRDKFYIKSLSGGFSLCPFGFPTDSACNVLPNNVGYVCGRFNEIYSELTGYEGAKYPYLNCNAEDFPERCKKMYPDIKMGKTPKYGDIIVWQNENPEGAGHVAFVERINKDGTLTITESCYGAYAGKEDIISNENKNWGMPKSYKFKCFIHNPAVTKEIIDEYEQSQIGVKKVYPGVLPTSIVSPSIGTIEQVKMWQKFLNWYKNNNLQINGEFDTPTIEATKNFQLDNNLLDDGIVADKTIAVARKVTK